MNYNNPNYIEEYKIYDIFHNDNNELIIICPSLANAYIINYINQENKLLKLDLSICPYNHTYIYSINIDYAANIKLMINDFLLETYVNKYPKFNNEIIFTTLVKDEDPFILTWINYHLRLGITRFIIYDNSFNITLSSILDDYIKKNIVLLIKWIYPYDSVSQVTQQNHSIYAFKNSRYIGLFDIDEYINLQNETKIDIFFEKLIIDQNININDISSFRFLNKFFYNPNNLPIINNQFLNIYNCDYITQVGHEKNFVLPKNLITFSVHMVTSGKPMYNIDPKYAYFNHYYFLNKEFRGRNSTNLLDDSILKHI